MHSVTSLRRERFYWATETTSFALGTATNDMTAAPLHLGYVASGVMFAFVFVLTRLAYRVAGLNGVAVYWISYVLARPLGTSYADRLGVTLARDGLNWGPVSEALIFSLAFVIGVLTLRRTDRTKSAAPPIG